ncbi:MAG: hypothetical protein IJR58_00090 [Lachnospiraceae bacterium]|nr:hypothetical protein [Lachnospiraceae bacterium]
MSDVKKTDRFKEFDEDLIDKELQARPRETRARERRETEKKVYTIAAACLGVLLVTVLLFVRIVTRPAPAEEAAQASVSEDTLMRIAETPMVLAATVKEVRAGAEDTILETTIDNVLRSMTIEDKVAGLFIVTPEQLTGVEAVTGFGDATKNALATHPVGGIVYSEKNLKTKDQVKEMLGGVQGAAKYPVFLAINENGEKRSAAAKALGEEVMPSGSAVTSAEDARAAGETVGAYLSLNGFNMNLSPVANLLNGTNEDPLSGFAYSTDPSVCADLTVAFSSGLQATNTSACAKYFPAYGEEITKTKEEMYGNELDAFRAAIEADVDAIMAGNIVASGISGTQEPACLSPAVVTGLLREEMGYQGIVVTDALNMEVVTKDYDAKGVVIAALDAGCDMFLTPLDFNASYEGLLEAVAEGEVSEERIDASLRRIYRVKYR